MRAAAVVVSGTCGALCTLRDPLLMVIISVSLFALCGLLAAPPAVYGLRSCPLLSGAK
jgi:hypothetical protein